MAFITDETEGVKRETREAPPSNYLLKVETFSLLLENGIEKHDSKHFEAGGHKWKIVFFPNGNESRNGENHISMYLAIVHTSIPPAGWEVNAFFKFFLFDQLRGIYLTVQGSPRRFNGVSSEWGVTQFIPLDTFLDPSSGYLVNDTCFLGVEVFVIKNSGVGECLSMSNKSFTYIHEWKISQFSKLGKRCYSDEFFVGDYKWKLILYPKGSGRNEGYSLSVYLIAVDSIDFSPAQKVKAEYIISIQGPNKQKYSKLSGIIWFSSSITSWGFPSFMPLEDLNDPTNGFIVEDSCVIEAKVKVRGEIVQDIFKW